MSVKILMMVINKAMSHALRASDYIPSFRLTIDATNNSIRKHLSTNYITQSPETLSSKSVARIPESRENCHSKSIDNNRTDLSLDAQNIDGSSSSFENPLELSSSSTVDTDTSFLDVEIKSSASRTDIYYFEKFTEEEGRDLISDEGIHTRSIFTQSRIQEHFSNQIFDHERTKYIENWIMNLETH